jgi:hypothetical protein
MFPQLTKAGKYHYNLNWREDERRGLEVDAEDSLDHYQDRSSYASHRQPLGVLKVISKHLLRKLEITAGVGRRVCLNLQSLAIPVAHIRQTRLTGTGAPQCAYAGIYCRRLMSSQSSRRSARLTGDRCVPHEERRCLLHTSYSGSTYRQITGPTAGVAGQCFTLISPSAFTAHRQALEFINERSCAAFGGRAGIKAPSVGRNGVQNECAGPIRQTGMSSTLLHTRGPPCPPRHAATFFIHHHLHSPSSLRCSGGSEAVPSVWVVVVDVFDGVRSFACRHPTSLNTRNFEIEVGIVQLHLTGPSDFPTTHSNPRPGSGSTLHFLHLFQASKPTRWARSSPQIMWLGMWSYRGGCYLA